MELAQPKNWLDHVAIWCAKYLIVLIVVSAIVIWMGDSNRFAFHQIVGFLLPVWFLVVVIQLIVRRKRPFEQGRKPLVKMLIGAPSFPSAHTAISACVAGIFSYHYFRAGEDGALFFYATIVYALLAVVIAWSRVRVGVHYVSDTIAGGIIGFGIPWAIFHLIANA